MGEGAARNKTSAGETHLVLEELQQLAVKEGMLTLRMSGLEKIKNGITTIEEVLRETVL